MKTSQQAGRRSLDDLTATLSTRNTSSILSDVEIDAVRHAISDHEYAIESLDGDIEGFVRTIRQLQYKKQQHLAEIRRCKGMITLARRLPPEILASIFEECVKDGWTRTPLIVSHVCSSWRKAARIPTVWSHIYVNLDAHDPYKRTCLWLEKSQDTPLMIDLEVGNDMSYLDRIMELLAAEMRRWKVLTIKSVMLHPINQILEVCSKPAPQLRAVRIAVAQEFILDPNDMHADRHELVAFRTAFLDAPKLQSLCIDRNVLPGRNIIPSCIAHLSLRLPCHHATTIQSISSIIGLLGDLPLLETFFIEVPNGHHQSFELDADQGRRVELSSLKSLTLTGLNNIFGLLAHLRLPTLTHLHLRASIEYNQAEGIDTWIVQCLKESSPPISLLEIRDLGIDPLAYGQLFQVLPLLEELRLHDSDIVDGILEQLNGPQGLCPFLKVLDLRWCGRLSGRALVDLVRSRLWTDLDSAGSSSVSQRITEITVINCSFVKEEDIMDLAEMAICRLIHGGQDDFCYAYGCCENERYRKRLKQRLLFRSSHIDSQTHPNHHLVL